MKDTEKYLVWGKWLWALLWALVLVGIAYDMIWHHFINPLGILILSILILGTIISRWHHRPLITTQGWLQRMIFAIIILIIAGGYVLFYLFISKW